MKTYQKQWLRKGALSLLLLLSFGSTSLAFDDIAGTPQEESILSLKEAGIVNGVDANHFDPKGPVSYGEAVPMIVKGLDLNIDNIRFIKAPQASDFFANVANDAWNAEAFIIASLNGLPIPSDVQPQQTISAQDYAMLLTAALRDSAAAAQGTIAFDTTQEMNRGLAADWLYKARQLASISLSVETEKVSDEVNKVTLSWGSQPNSGYAIQITRIEFNNGQAHIYYTLSYPEPDKMYAQVITYPKAVTYIDSQYKPVAVPVKPAAPDPAAEANPPAAVPHS
ncbi:protease complex subunit PrcB family protein [Paenibacillus sp. y28]|uniref:protease complex subunit PrcB family protein n=1 Tax=Paenibacillus sp. y28 TaxID=3129110 RepID=UPI00301B1BA3